MHKALNTVLAQLPDDTKVYVSLELPSRAFSSGEGLLRSIH